MATIRANGVDLYYERRGPRPHAAGRAGAPSYGEPVLFVHGLFFSAAHWRPQMDALEGEYEVVAIDLRGQHRSEAPEDQAGYGLWNQVEDVLGIINGLGIAPVHYVGLSMGGMIGMRLALTRPDVLRSLTLMDTTARAEDPDRVDVSNTTRSLALSGELERILAVIPQSFLGEEFIAQHPDQVETWIDSLRKGNVEGFMRALGGVIQRDDVTDRLGEIKLPTLVIHGGNDVLIELFKGEELAAKIPGARLEVIEGAGHQSNVDHPAEVARLIKDFLASVRTGAAAPAS